MKTTALYHKHLNLNAKMTEFAGFNMPLVYSSITKEHDSVRNDIGIFDVSHMGNIIIKGNQALTFVNTLVTNTIENTFGKVTYACILNERGFTIDDVLVYSFSESHIMIVCNASNIKTVYAWIKRHHTDETITIKNASDEYSQIAVQGPNSEHIVSKILLTNLKDLSFMTFKLHSTMDNLIISRTGYTGEDGFEIYGNHLTINTLFDQFIDLGVKPIGLGARDTLRFEAALPLYGHELSLHIHPFEAGLSFAIKDTPFIGFESLFELKQKMTRRLVGIKMLDRGIPRAHYLIYHKDQQVGEVTTGYQLPNKSYGLAFALINKPFDVLGTKLDIDIRGKRIPIEVIKKSFMTKKYKKES
ncbi:MAG: glycine cleavage system aminomethyltransferase GcvT [Acholeplasmataceae bacterium]